MKTHRPTSRTLALLAGLLSALVMLSSSPTLGARDTVAALAAPEDVGMSSAVLRSGVTLFEEALERDDLKGAVLLVGRRGRIVLHEAIGWRNQEEGLALEKDTLFRMASNTKPVIASAILILVEEGKLSLDDNVRKYLDGWDTHRSAYIQVRHLLSHTSGLRINTLFLSPLMKMSADHPDAPNLVLESDRFGAIGADFEPGTTYAYNNPGFNTLGALVEIASDMTLKDFLRTRIYGPLGMVDSYNHEPDAPNDRMSRVYRRRGGTWSIQWNPHDPSDVPFPRASGGMVSTAGDYYRFLQMYLGGGKLEDVRILESESVALGTRSHTDHVEMPGRDGAGYGFGWRVERDGTYSHGGSDGTWAWVDPAREIVGIVFTQSAGGKIPRQQFRRVVNASISD